VWNKSIISYYNMYYRFWLHPVARGGGLAVNQNLALPQKPVYQRQGMVRQGLPQDPVQPAPGIVRAGF